MKSIFFPLHPAQRDVYTDQLIDINSPHYNIGGYIKLKGVLDKKKFLETIRFSAEVIDAFKFRFNHDEAEPVFYFEGDYAKKTIKEIDFSSNTNAEEKAKEWVVKEFNTALLIKKHSLPFEEYLLKINDKEYWFFGKYHHLIMDGYGFVLFVKYIEQKYKALINGSEVQFHYLPYKDEVLNASAYLNSNNFAIDSLYWKNRIGSPPKKILQQKYRQKKNTVNKSETYILQLTDDQQSLLKNLVSFTGSGIQQLTIAALLIYFGKTTGQSEFVFGLPLHKRGSRNLRNIVGMFSGVLPFKGIYDEEKKLNDLLAEIVHSQKKDYRHLNYPIGDLVRSFKATSLQDYIYQVSIDYEPFNFQLDMGTGLLAQVNRVSNDHDKNPLQVCWLEYGDHQSLRLQVHYGNAYFNQPEIELFVQRLLFILEQFPTKLYTGICAIDILPGAEKDLINEFNNTIIDFPTGKSIVDVFEEQVKNYPLNIALIYKKQQLTYQELNELSNQLGHYLQAKGVKEGTLVPICMKRSVEMIVAILGILKAGGAYVPIDPEYPEERIRFMLEDINGKMILTSKDCVDNLKINVFTQVVLLDEDWHLINNFSKENLKGFIKINQLAYIIYTSGSTGKPKGVLIEHSGVVNLINAQSLYFNLNSEEKILQFSNYCFDASVEQIFLALFNGATLVLFAEGLQLNLDLFSKFVKDNNITHLHATPAFLEKLHLATFKNLKRLIAGGDLCKIELAAQWKNLVAFYNEYGPTETTVTSIEYYAQAENEYENLTLPIGRPISNTQLYILDKNKYLLPIGVAGELFIAGAGVARGYLNRAALTAQRFINNPFTTQPGSIMYNTGDLARWLPDGNVEYLGRIDDQVKIRGYRIELGEIENVLQELEFVKQAVVVARDDREGQKQLVGFVVSDVLINRELIQNALRKKLPDYMVPSLWVQLESIPLTSNGKIDRKSLPNPDLKDILSNEYVAPENDLELQLTNLWKEVLKLDEVGVKDNFFELGGHSLNAIRVTSRLHKLFNLKIDIGTIFSNPTIRELGQVLISEKQLQFVSIKPIPQQEYYPLSHAQKRFWVLSHFKDGAEVYNVSSAFIINGRLNMKAFKRAFNTVIERHEILRTVFIEIEGEPLQKILSLQELDFKIKEINLKETDHVINIVKNKLEEESRYTFNLAKGPLLRVTVFYETIERAVLVFNIHHIISDGWSKGILIKEVLQLYKTYCMGGINDLPTLSIQYKDYAAWHNEAYKMQGLYWRRLYEDGVPVLNFPVDFERPKVLAFFGAMIKIRITETLTQGLRKRALEHNTSLNNLLFALYGLLVGRYSGQEDIIIGSLSSGRSHVDLENLVGVFINFLPIKLSPAKELNLSTYINDSHYALVAAYNNQDYPFDLMVEDCIEQRNISRNPFFDTMVNFHLENDLQDKNIFEQTELKETGIWISPFQAGQEDIFQSVLDFKLDIEIVENSLDFYLSYNSKLFLKETMDLFLEEFVELLTRVVNEPAKDLKDYGNWEKGEPPAINENPILVNPTSDSTLPLHICASFVMEPVQEFIEYWSKEFDLNIEVSFAPYNQVFQQLIHPQSLLHKAKGINVLFIRLDDWLRDQTNTSAPEQIILLNQTYFELIKAIEAIKQTSSIPFLFGIVPLFNAALFSKAVSERINILNNELAIFINHQPRFHLLDILKISELYDVEDLFDAKADELGHMPFTQELYAALGTFIARKTHAFTAPGYKVIALDCDNTLWQGVCGEVGALEVIIDENFSALQQFMLEKYKEGFLLTLCSKNNEADVWEVFDRHPQMKLKREHFAAYRINWEAKSNNLLSLSKELNLGLNSFIFIDDSEFEIEQVSQQCPDVLAIGLPENPGEFKSFLDHIWAFDYFLVTEEDANRNKMYQVEKQRKEELEKFSSLQDFLDTLNIQVIINDLTGKDLERAVQLTLRTNQFNLNGVRKTGEEISASIHLQNTVNWVIEVKDRFGDYGIVGVLLAKEKGNSLEIETFLLSCRVLGRNIEDKILAALEEYGNSKQVKKITVLFKATSKNKPFQEFLIRTKWAEELHSKTYYRLLK